MGSVGFDFLLLAFQIFQRFDKNSILQREINLNNIPLDTHHLPPSLCLPFSKESLE